MRTSICIQCPDFVNAGFLGFFCLGFFLLGCCFLSYWVLNKTKHWLSVSEVLRPTSWRGGQTWNMHVRSRLVWWCKSVWILQLFWLPGSQWHSSAVRLLRGTASAVAFWEFQFSAGAEKFCPHCNGTVWRQMVFNGTFKHTVKQKSEHPSSCHFLLLLLLDNPICSSSPTAPPPQPLSFLFMSPHGCGLSGCSWWGWLPCVHTAAPWD